jgi:hypothetical protein
VVTQFTEAPAADMTVPLSPARGGSALLIASYVLLLGAIGYQLFCVMQPIEFINQHLLLMDDAFYYFQIARNWAKLGWPTFDGSHAASGIQLLWGFLLYGLARITPDRVGFIRSVLVLSVLLNLAVGIALLNFGRRLLAIEVGAVAALIWAGYILNLWPTLLGMEYPLHILIVVGLIWMLWFALSRPAEQASPGFMLLLGLVLTLNFWARLDAGVLSLLVWLVMAARLLRRHPSRQRAWLNIAALSAIPAAGTIAYVATCYRLAGTPAPISGLVKSYYASQHFRQYGPLVAAAGHGLWWLEVQLRPIVDIVFSPLASSSVFGPLPMLVIAGVLAGSLWATRRIWRCRNTERQSHRAMIFLGLLLVFGAIHAAVVVMTIGHFSHVTQHYYGWQFVVWCLWGAILAATFLAQLRAPRVRTVVVLVGIVLFVSAYAWNARNTFLDVQPLSYQNQRMRLAEWINRDLPLDASVGAWNAGALAYFADRRVVNLDGLVNDRSFLQDLRQGRPIQGYLERNKIEYLADVDAADLTFPYRASWDHSRFFRGAFPWETLDVLHVEAGGDLPVFLVRLRKAGQNALPDQ